MYSISTANAALELVFSTLSAEDRGACSFVCKEWRTTVRKIEKKDYLAGWKIKENTDILLRNASSFSKNGTHDIRAWFNVEDIFSIDMRFAATVKSESMNATAFYGLISLLRTKYRDAAIERLQRYALFHPCANIKHFVSSYLVPRLGQKSRDKGVQLVVGSATAHIFYSSVGQMSGIKDIYAQVANAVASVVDPNIDLTMTVHDESHSESHSAICVARIVMSCGEKEASFRATDIETWQPKEVMAFALYSTKMFGNLAPALYSARLLQESSHNFRFVPVPPPQ